jgi:hypothetical protein
VDLFSLGRVFQLGRESLVSGAGCVSAGSSGESHWYQRHRWAVGGKLFTLATGWLVQNVSYGPVFIVASIMIFCAATGVILLVPRQRMEAVT